MKSVLVSGIFTIVFMAALTGCVGHTSGNTGQLPVFAVPIQEAAWIRNGEPLEFEGVKWFPKDAVEILLDSEVSLIGEYKGVQLFIERVDVRPYNTIYTKFGKNKFRAFKESLRDDQR